MVRNVLKRQLESEITRVLRLVKHQFGLRLREDVLFGVVDGYVVSVSCFVEGVAGNTITLRAMLKPMVLDDVFWDVFDMSSNRRGPLSLRVYGAFTVGALPVAMSRRQVDSVDQVALFIEETVLDKMRDLRGLVARLGSLEEYARYADRVAHGRRLYPFDSALTWMLIDIIRGGFAQARERAMLELANHRSGNMVNGNRNIYEYVVDYCRAHEAQYGGSEQGRVISLQRLVGYHEAHYGSECFEQVLRVVPEIARQFGVGYYQNILFQQVGQYWVVLTINVRVDTADGDQLSVFGLIKPVVGDDVLWHVFGHDEFRDVAVMRCDDALSTFPLVFFGRDMSIDESGGREQYLYHVLSELVDQWVAQSREYVLLVDGVADFIDLAQQSVVAIIEDEQVRESRFRSNRMFNPDLHYMLLDLSNGEYTKARHRAHALLEQGKTGFSIAGSESYARIEEYCMAHER